GCDGKWNKTISGNEYFNPRTHKGCDFIPARKEETNDNFNPRTHKGCDMGQATTKQALSYFNPRTHKGCDISLTCIISVRIFISIHAPIKDATLFCITKI